MGLGDLFSWQQKAAVASTPSMPAVEDEDLAADVDEPPERQKQELPADFHKNAIQYVMPQRKESLLTQALKNPDVEPSNSESPLHVATDLMRRRSMISSDSIASTAELTSDGGLTSPARTNTPSPPPPYAQYSSFAPYSLGSKAAHRSSSPTAVLELRDSVSHVPELLSISPKTRQPTEVIPKKRCITFACGAAKSAKVAPQRAPAVSQPSTAAPAVTVTPKRECRIKFACSGLKPSDAAKQLEAPKVDETPKVVEPVKRTTVRSSSSTRKSSRSGATSRPSHRDSTGTVRSASHSPAAVRSKPRYIIADEKTIAESEAARFHEFASEVMEEDDWIRKDCMVHRNKMTINDTLKKENAIRQLGDEAEQEALEEDENDDEEDDGNDSDIESGFDDEEQEEEEENEDAIDDYEDNGSDGNESDNEAGFADSDDENGDDELAFWTPGRHIRHGGNIATSTYRASAHRTASPSSIDSLRRRSRRHRQMPTRPLRPGTPDLPDSTDFPCGTLDEDRPLEDAYKSCLEVRRKAKHLQTPQDIDPSFPTSEPEDEEDEHDDLPPTFDSADHAWHLGKFEYSDDERVGRRRSAAARRKSPQQSPKTKRLHSPPPPKRLHSPPPAGTKSRLRSPPPRKLFGGHSPRRLRSPPPQAINSPPGSPVFDSTTAAIAFAPLGSRPGLTQTKSLPRTPNAFCRAYHAYRLIAANGNSDEDSNDGHVRGAIDIVKGLEQKRQRRKEKFYQRHCNRKGKTQVERRPQPGKGAERMRELGLLMAGKAGSHGNPLHMMSA